MAVARDMFQRKIDELFQGLPTMFGIVDDILIAGFDDMDTEHNAKLNKVLRICRQGNVKLTKDCCLFWCISIPFFWEVTAHSGVSPDPRNIQALMAMPPPKCKKELRSFLAIVNYLGKFSPMPAEV